MPAPQDHPLKSLADEMARLLSGSDGENAVLLMERLGLLSLPERNRSGTQPGFVGIWKAGPKGYERSADMRHEWRLWADVELIPPKGERKRVLLVGESVARGYLYDPDFNPAKALEAALPAVLGQPVEIIDLAKINLTGPQLMGLLGTVPALEPDILIVFAGNNWLLADKRDRYLEAAALRAGGALALKARREQSLAAFVDILRQQLNELSARLPVVLLVPEINLVDWRLDGKTDAPWLPLGRNRRWLECHQAALSALASQRFDEAAALAQEMVDLDGGTAASGCTILADCARGMGDLTTARTYLERARDAHLWDFTHQTPRAVSVIQQALRDCALPSRISVVDLPSCFATWQGGELPGRRLFLDYCHLSAEGIRVSMAATALAVANLLDGDRPLSGIESLANEIPTPCPYIEATTHFTAAIHSSYWGQSGSFVSYLCDEAARQSPEVAQAMRAYLEIQTRNAPIWTCSAFDRLSAVAPPFLRSYILRNPKLFEPVLLPAIAEALEKNGLPSLVFLDELRQNERGLSDRPCDLLDSYYRATLEDLDWIEWPTHFQRAYSPISRYPWVSRVPREVTFTLNCRRTGATGPGECQVRINGTCVIPLPLTHEWSTFHFSASSNLVRSGVNWLEIEWPIDLPDGKEKIEHIAREHEHGRLFPLLPAFAEISSLTAVQR
jgi:hypothetical protein